MDQAPASINLEALLLLLKPASQCPMIGEESGQFKANGPSRLDSPYGSVRYVFAIAGEIVSALQIMVSQSGAVATNACTHPKHQRRQYASILAKLALKDFPHLKFSDERSDDGEKWVSSLRPFTPFKLFHGTKSEFDKINPSRGGEYGSGVYLTDDIDTAWKYAERAKGDGHERVLVVEASIHKPFHAADRETVRSLGVKKMMAMGHDGIIGIGPTGERQYVAFLSSAIHIVESIQKNEQEKQPLVRCRA